MIKTSAILIDPEVKTVFESYPQKIKEKLLFLRNKKLEVSAIWEMVDTIT